ncbi:hypothetical protein BJV82DRAFT_689332 [Fennellomyces sp. T-0311]|nr:hypothetical protein BJV82DRAFT_689332 [Fennellomyces sp. T-0311]
MLPNKRSRTTLQSDPEPSTENAQSPNSLPPRHQSRNHRSVGSPTSSTAPWSSATERSNNDGLSERLAGNQQNTSPITISDDAQSAGNYNEQLPEDSPGSQAESQQQTPSTTTHRPWSPSAVRDPNAPVQNTPVYYRVNDTPATFVIFGYVYEVDETSLAGLRRVGHESDIAPHLYPHYHHYNTAPTHQASPPPRQASPPTYQPSPSSQQATPVYQPSSSRQATNTCQQSSSPAPYQSPVPSYVFPTYVPVTTRSPVNAFNSPGSSRQHEAAFYNPATPQAQSPINQRAESANVDGASPEGNYPSYYPGSPSRAAEVDYTEDYFNQRDFIERLENEGIHCIDGSISKI